MPKVNNTTTAPAVRPPYSQIRDKHYGVRYHSIEELPLPQVGYDHLQIARTFLDRASHKLDLAMPFIEEGLEAEAVTTALGELNQARKVLKRYDDVKDTLYALQPKPKEEKTVQEVSDNNANADDSNHQAEQRGKTTNENRINTNEHLPINKALRVADSYLETSKEGHNINNINSAEHAASDMAGMIACLVHAFKYSDTPSEEDIYEVQKGWALQLEYLQTRGEPLFNYIEALNRKARTEQWDQSKGEVQS